MCRSATNLLSTADDAWAKCLAIQEICCAPALASVVLCAQTVGTRIREAGGPRSISWGVLYMEAKSRVSDEGEVLGIVISCGNRPPVVPRFSAFVWSAAPDDADQESKAA